MAGNTFGTGVSTAKLILTSSLAMLMRVHSPAVATDSGCGNKPACQLLRVLEEEGRQGVASDGESHFVSGNTTFYRCSEAGEFLAKNDHAVENLSPPANHIGDISVHDGQPVARKREYPGFR